MNQARDMRVTDSVVRGVRIYELRQIIDPARGNLTVGEFGDELPFLPKRFFLTYQIPQRTVRGEHAHRKCEQFLICVRGSCVVSVDDGGRCDQIVLDRPTLGIYVPPMVWAVEHQHSWDSTLMVFASEHYEPDDYIRDYTEFLRLAGVTRDVKPQA